MHLEGDIRAHLCQRSVIDEDLLRSLNSSPMQSSRRMMIEPFSGDIAALLRTRMTFMITFSIERY